MLHDGRSVRVAVIGGSRIPFCRSHSIYRKCSNQDLMTAALQGLVNKLDLRGQSMGDVARGAVIKQSAVSPHLRSRLGWRRRRVRGSRIHSSRSYPGMCRGRGRPYQPRQPGR